MNKKKARFREPKVPDSPVYWWRMAWLREHPVEAKAYHRKSALRYYYRHRDEINAEKRKKYAGGK